MNEDKSNLAMGKGINFLAKGQEKDGSFMCLVSTKFDDYKPRTRANAVRGKNAPTVYTVPTIVPTNIVLSSLIHISESDVAKSIKQKVAKFLLGEKGEYWSFNYWSRRSDWYKVKPYPDDTDDTFCALAALYEYDPELFDGEAMAKIVTMLTSCEKEEGGHYDMWLVPPKARKKWSVIDLVCNANIAYFLSFQDIYLPKVATFIEKSINEKNYEFPYNTIYPAIYFVSRFYRGKKNGKIVNLLLSKQKSDGRWENPLRTALAISSLINLEGLAHLRQIKNGVKYLLKTQNKDGGWEPYSFYFHMHTKKETFYAGSPFITTALCLEAINKFQKFEARNSKSETDSASSPQANSKSEILNSKQEKYFYNEIIRKYRRRFVGFSKNFQEKAVAVALKISKKNRDIVLLPQYFRDALGKCGEKISDELVGKLGTANLFGWVAYTIYDDFLDEEGDPQKLSLANVCLRESVEIFETILPKSIGFSAFAKKIFDTIDNANMWEVSTCRDMSAIPYYGDYARLADKSLGHSLGPIAILCALGYKTNSVEVKHMMRFFRNYIIARQLNDDAHDWEDDLKKGHVNAVSAQLLKDAKGESKNLKKSREIFWHTTIVGTCKDILRHVELAKKDLKKLTVIKEPEIFMEMLATIERSAEEALREREETMKFLKTYSHRE